MELQVLVEPLSQGAMELQVLVEPLRVVGGGGGGVLGGVVMFCVLTGVMECRCWWSVLSGWYVECPETTCQEVVIALAQDLGQTGRYVLTLNLRGSERQLLKDECPLQELSNLGPDSENALLILRRTGPSSSLPLGAAAALEERQRQNQEELMQEQYWTEQLEEENRKAKDLSDRLEQLQWSVHHQSQRLSSLQSQTQDLQTDTQKHTEQALRPLQHELNQRHQQGDRITAALEETQRDMHKADRRFKIQRQKLEDLKKDLRQCNLQQFIQASSPAPSDLYVQPGAGPAPSDLFVQSGAGSGPYDVTNIRPGAEIYLSNAGILE
ncbi:hypothetical protein WMY93_000045 [Mugilogobius chulae]|uniref:Ras-associating domain-containing protein n=1 Tax=Mugilogobius chulae TaxID=88201 RepID=A0AAW0Q108_9GOBI